MKVITVLNHKGGVGKTFISCVLAELLMIAGKKVVVLDLDDQLNSVDHLRKMDGTPVFEAIDIVEACSEIPDFTVLEAERYDVAIADTPPQFIANPIVRDVMEHSDMFIIPFMLNRHSLFGVEKTLSLLPEGKPILPICSHTSVMTKDKKELLKLVNEQLGSDDRNLKKVLHLPWYDRVDANLSERRDFFFGLTEKQYKLFSRFASEVLKVMV